MEGSFWREKEPRREAEMIFMEGKKEFLWSFYSGALWRDLHGGSPSLPARSVLSGWASQGAGLRTRRRSSDIPGAPKDPESPIWLSSGYLKSHEGFLTRSMRYGIFNPYLSYIGLSERNLKDVNGSEKLPSPPVAVP